MDNKKALKFSLWLTLTLMPMAFFGSIGLSVILCGAFLAYLYVSKKGHLALLGSIGVFTFSLIFFGFDFFLALITALQIALLSRIIYKGLCVGGKFSHALLPGSGVCLVSNMLFTYSAAREMGTSPVKLLFEMPLSESVEILKNTEGVNSEYIGVLSQQMEELTKAFELLAPAYLIISAIMLCFFTFSLARYVAEKKGIETSHLPYFCELSMPRGITAVFLLIFVFIFVFGTSAVMLNIAAVMLSLLTVCGMSVADYYVKKHARLRMGFRILIYIAAFLIMSAFGMGTLLSGILFAAGALDSFVCLRK